MICSCDSGKKWRKGWEQSKVLKLNLLGNGINDDGTVPCRGQSWRPMMFWLLPCGSQSASCTWSSAVLSWAAGPTNQQFFTTILFPRYFIWVLGIRDILVRSRSGSVPIMDSAPDPDPTPDPIPFFSDFKDAKKIAFSYYFSLNLPTGTYSIFSLKN